MAKPLSRLLYQQVLIATNRSKSMPELPDVHLYVQSLNRLLASYQLQKVIIKSPFLLRTFEPDFELLNGRTIERFSRLEKKIVWHFEGGLCAVFHLMITGRFHWRAPNRLPKQKMDLAAFQFEHGTMMLTEASPKKRASLHIVSSEVETKQFRRGGLEVLDSSPSEFEERLLVANKTLKRVLTDPTSFSGIGNAYSDEILHAAKLSPLQRTGNLKAAEIERLHAATKSVLSFWMERLLTQTGDAFPEKVTAFRPEMLAHGKFKQPCGVCGDTIQRIRYAENECNYCPTCQTGGKLLADRSLSRLLKDEWGRQD